MAAKEEPFRQPTEAEEAAYSVANALRLVRRMSLDKQAQSMRSRLALRKMVEERLSHPLLEQMKSDEFDRNPLAEDEALVVDEDAAALSRTLSGIHGLPTASSSRRTSLEDDGEPGEDAAAMAAFEAKFMRGPAAAPAGAPSGAIGLNVNSSELDDLVRLKNLVMAHDVTGEQHSTLPHTTLPSHHHSHALHLSPAQAMASTPMSLSPH